MTVKSKTETYVIGLEFQVYTRCVRECYEMRKKFKLKIYGAFNF